MAAGIERHKQERRVHVGDGQKIKQRQQTSFQTEKQHIILVDSGMIWDQALE